ncbi:TetR/AcrR family transcriptional regulator [Ruthenibacterium sp. TH_2024_36131]|uniref:TetR/AcrR family transcriptional regulator n=1 Tax=Owariibacterium komagatae TaxID=3136601 RepID=UPI0038B397CF
MPRQTPLQREGKEQHLLDAAYKLFLGKGVLKTSIDEIVWEADVAKGTFYLYFRNKEDLLQKLVEKISTRILSEAYHAMRQHSSTDFAENVVTMVDYIVEYFKYNKLQLQLLERNFSWPMVRQAFSDQSDPLWKNLAQDLAQSPLAQRYSEDELFKLMFVLVEMCGSVCYSSIIEGKPDTIDHMKPTLYRIIRQSLS